jgi:hypothetical protein
MSQLTIGIVVTEGIQERECHIMAAMRSYRKVNSLILRFMKLRIPV